MAVMQAALSSQQQHCAHTCRSQAISQRAVARHRAALPLQPQTQSCRCYHRHQGLVVRAGLKIRDNYDSKLELSTESDKSLRDLLSSPTFQQQVSRETGQPAGTQVSFTGMLFQPVPWSPNTKLGMPQEFEKYKADPGTAQGCWPTGAHQCMCLRHLQEVEVCCCAPQIMSSSTFHPTSCSRYDVC